MIKENVIGIITTVVNEYFATQNINEAASKDTILFGKDSFLDSMGLVNVIIDVESKIFEEKNKEISLTSESAMSRSRSPFKTIETLADFIMEQDDESDD